MQHESIRDEFNHVVESTAPSSGPMHNILVQVSRCVRSVAAGTYPAAHEMFSHGWFEALEHSSAPVFENPLDLDVTSADRAD